MAFEGTEHGKDNCTGLCWCMTGREGMTAFAAAEKREKAQRRSEERLEAFLRRMYSAPFLLMPGLGHGADRVSALGAAWESLFHAAVRVKLRYLGIVPPVMRTARGDAFFDETSDAYERAGMKVLFRDCSMMKSYPVLGIDTGGKIYTGSGVTRSEALLNCLEYEILERRFGIKTGIALENAGEASYPPSDPFHIDAETALHDYIAAAQRYGARPRAKDFSTEDLYIYQLYPENIDRRTLDENTLVFSGGEI